MINENIWVKFLNPAEEIKYEFTLGKEYLKVGLISGCIVGFLFLFLFFLFGISIILISVFYYGWYLKNANKYAFTDKRVLIYKGWLSTKLTSIDYDKITDIEVREPFLDKQAYKTGILSINTAGTTLREVVLRYIENPYEVKKKLDELRDAS